MKPSTKAQRKALYRVWLRDQAVPYRTFRRTAINCGDYFMVQFAGMWLGVEKDGYTHS